MNTYRSSFGCRGLRRTFHQIHIPARSFRQRNREHGAIAVYHIEADQQGYAETAFFNRHTLGFACTLRSYHIEYRADQPFFDKFTAVATSGYRTCRIHRSGKLIQLSDLLVESHLLQQRIYFTFGLLRNIPGISDTYTSTADSG